MVWHRVSLTGLVVCAVTAVGPHPAIADHVPESLQKPSGGIRVATFNVSLNRRDAGQLASDLAEGDSQARKVAAILRHVRPDIVLLNEFDYDADGRSIDLFQRHYLDVEDTTSTTLPLKLPHTFVDQVNTGQPTGLDLDKDGRSDGPADAYGFGHFPGQYGMVLLSRFPIDRDAVRTFRRVMWKDIPRPSIPRDPTTGEDWYGAEVWPKLRLSSKSHWVVPIKINQRTINILASHPTPPAFDGPEDRNGRRNRDEIMLLKHLISGNGQSWLKDDAGRRGGLSNSTSFVICGDLNADPNDGDSFENPIQQLMDHPRVQPVAPVSAGAASAAVRQGGANQNHTGDPRHDTADFSDRVVGNLRVDYVLPSRDLHVLKSGVFWPDEGQPKADTITCSDHRLVWIDIRLAD